MCSHFLGCDHDRIDVRMHAMLKVRSGGDLIKRHLFFFWLECKVADILKASSLPFLAQLAFHHPSFGLAVPSENIPCRPGIFNLLRIIWHVFPRQRLYWHSWFILQLKAVLAMISHMVHMHLDKVQRCDCLSRQLSKLCHPVLAAFDFLLKIDGTGWLAAHLGYTV